MATNDEPDDDDLEVPDCMKDVPWATATPEQSAEIMESLKRSMEDVKAGRTRLAREFIESLRRDEGGAGGVKL